MIKSLKVEYSGGEVDQELDAEIGEFFESKGFKWTGQGMDLITNVRDIRFIKDKAE